MTLGSHQTSIGKSQVHITPRWIIDALGPFDLDPCAAFPRPWDCAKENLAQADDGLDQEWHAQELVWLNPPFDRRGILAWITKLVQHKNGIALLHARTETAWFRLCWQHASGIFFLHQRVIFCKPDGSPQTTLKGEVANSGAPVCFVAFGELANERLLRCRLEGTLVTGWKNFSLPRASGVDNQKRSA
jgi:hypothetical protein